MADDTRKVRLDSDERYPFFHVPSTGGYEAEVPAATYDRWRQVMRDFVEVQNEMEEAYDDARKRDVLAAAEARADELVEEARGRLARAHFKRANPPWLPESWTPPGDDDVCAGWRYDSRDEAKAERMALHNNFPDVRFDLKAYVCVDGHHHLRRRA